MEVVQSLTDLKNRYDNIIVAIGNFDGVHRGHRQLIHEVLKAAAEIKGTPVVLTFEPHPLKVLKPRQSLPLLLTTQRKINIIAACGIEVLVLLPFNLNVAGMDPLGFVHEVLYDSLNAKIVCVGYNFTFGQSGKGTPSLLQTYGRQFGFQVVVIPPVNVSGIVVSSTAVREALTQGDIKRARSYLGYWPILEGKVVSGEGRGRHLGFPTANLVVDRDILLPPRGVYIARAELEGQWFTAVVNIGYKPTFGSNLPETIEIHILDFGGDLYGKYLLLELRQKIRSEQKFNDIEELVGQINKDILTTRYYFSIITP